jgi:hypothetical protein
MQYDEHEHLNADDAGLESALKSLTPRRAAVDPISAAFAAGRRSSQRTLRAWQSAAAAMLLLAGGSWAMRLTTAPSRTSPAVVVELPATSMPRAQALGDQTLIMLQRAVDDSGIDGLPASPLPSVRPLHANDML